MTGDFGGYAAVRRTAANTIERSRRLCEESRLIAEDRAAQRDHQAANRRTRKIAAQQQGEPDRLPTC
jgi:hypothetical protein